MKACAEAAVYCRSGARMKSWVLSMKAVEMPIWKHQLGFLSAIGISRVRDFDKKGSNRSKSLKQATILSLSLRLHDLTRQTVEGFPVTKETETRLLGPIRHVDLSTAHLQLVTFTHEGLRATAIRERRPSHRQNRKSNKSINRSSYAKNQAVSKSSKIMTGVSSEQHHLVQKACKNAAATNKK